MRLKRKTAEDKLRVTDSFLRTYAPLAYTAQGKVGVAVREALLAGRAAELEAGIVSRREARSGLTLVWQPAPPPVENAPSAHVGFWMQRTEVPVRAYRACVQAGACSAPEEGVGCTWVPGDVRADALPVTCASREQAEAFCAWTGGRLPSLGEWRYAAQGGEGRPYPWGEAPPDDARAWFNRKPDVRQVGLAAAGASRWGVLDLAGNVSEFTRGEGPRGVYAVGGSFRDGPEGVRADAALREDGFTRRAHLGFRCVE
jgi:formylglycine-generating enzyme required for sulfatase activity